MNGIQRSAVLGLLLLTGGVANAVPIHFQETASYDVDDYRSQFALQPGTNMFAGNVRAIFGIGIPVEQWQFDSDEFYFNIPDGTRVDAIRLSWQTMLLPGTQVFNGGIDFMWGTEDEDGPNAQRREATLDLRNDGVGFRPFDAYLTPSIGSDFYRLFMLWSAGARGTPGQFAGGTVNYTWAIDVGALATPPATVPEPGTFALLALGMAGLVTLRRRVVVA